MYDVIPKLPLSLLLRRLPDFFHKPTPNILELLQAEGLDFHGQIFTFDHLRSGLDSIFRHSHFKKVIFPAFICPIIIDAAIKNGIQPVLVDVRFEDFHLDVDRLTQSILQDVDAIFVNHTFGSAFDINALRVKIGERPITIIEDMAHALFTRTDGAATRTDGFGSREELSPQYLSPQGVFSLVSFYKQVPNIGGGAVIAKNVASLKTKINVSPATKKTHFSLRDVALFALILNAPHQLLLHLYRRFSKLPEETHRSDWHINNASRFSTFLFQTYLPRLREEVRLRQKLLPVYASFVDPHYLLPQQSSFGTPSAVFYSVRLQGPYIPLRDELVHTLRRHGFFFDRLWYNAPAVLPDFQQFFNGNCPKSRLLAQSIINMPISAQYRPNDVKKLFHTLYQTLDFLHS